MLLGIVLAAWLVIATAGDTPIGAWLRRQLVERPAARLNRVSAGQVALVAGFLLVAGLATWWGAGDGARMAGMAIPDLAMWLASAELTAYADLIVAAVIGWSVARSSAAQHLTSVRIAARVRRVVRRRQRRTGRARASAANDNSDDRTSAFAA